MVQKNIRKIAFTCIGISLLTMLILWFVVQGDYQQFFPENPGNDIWILFSFS